MTDSARRSTRHHPAAAPPGFDLKAEQAKAVAALAARDKPVANAGAPTRRDDAAVFAEHSNSPRVENGVCPKCGNRFDGRAVYNHLRYCEGDPSARPNDIQPIAPAAVVNERAKLLALFARVASQMGQAAERGREAIRLRRHPVEINAAAAVTNKLFADLDPNDTTAIRNVATQARVSIIEFLYGKGATVEETLDRWEAAGRPVPKLPEPPAPAPVAASRKLPFGRTPKHAA